MVQLERTYDLVHQRVTEIHATAREGNGTCFTIPMFPVGLPTEKGTPIARSVRKASGSQADRRAAGAGRRVHPQTEAGCAMQLISLRTPLFLATAVVLVGACEQGGVGTVTEPFTPPVPSFTVGNPGDIITKPTQIDFATIGEQLIVCKDGSNATFTWAANGTPANAVGSPFSIDGSSGEVCLIVAEKGGSDITVTVTETDPGAGFQLQKIVVTQVQDGAVAGPTDIFPPQNSADGIIGGNLGTSAGAIIEFINEIAGEGCTPGYWKQSQHFDSWTAPLAPGADFTAPGFNSPGGDARVKRGRNDNNVVTQLQALQANKGDAAALTRHAMAALLNAASPDVSYDLTQAQIVQMYNDALAGTLDVEVTKNIFEGFNEQGCPLN